MPHGCADFASSATGVTCYNEGGDELKRSLVRPFT